MLERICIIIDDEDQDSTIENIVDALRRDGINLTCAQLNPADKKYRKTTGPATAPIISIDIDEILRELRTDEYFRRRVDLIALDYDFDDEEVNGFDLIDALRRDNYRGEIILYSGGYETLINNILDGASKSDQIKKIKSLGRSNIRYISDRTDYKETVIGCIRNPEASLETQLERMLEHAGNVAFSQFPEEFKGSSVDEMLHEIRKRTDLGKKFERRILEFAVSNLIELNAGD